MELNSPVSKLSFVGPIYQRRLSKLGIITIKDLLLHVPKRYENYSFISNIADCKIGQTLTIKAQILSLKNQYTRSGKNIQIGEVSDSTGKISVVWFNQLYLTRTLYPDREVSLSGKVDYFGNKKALISPEYEIINDDNKTLHTGKIIPIYPETSGISSKWLRTRINQALNATHDQFNEFLPKKILNKYKLPDNHYSIKSVHFPASLSEAERARERLAFNELFLLHLANSKKRLEWKKNKPSYVFHLINREIDEFIRSLPFTLTNSQKKSSQEILKDLSLKYPMNRLLQGDVGSGKTVVAAIAAYVCFSNGFQSVFMAPTQILANQHYKTLKQLFYKYKVRISLITSDLKKSDIGRTDIFIGTHALIHRKVNFDKVALVIIDEQHRFGVEQRNHLIKKSKKGSVVPHVLTMTATPIPRTVALTLYGDLDLTTLDEQPKGRQKITTWIVPKEKRGAAYEWIKSQITKNKSQIFVICPLIEESAIDTMKQVKAATSEYENLGKIFSNFSLGLLHGKMSSIKKEEVLAGFRTGKVDILVSTPVVEVGIDIPNATIILIEASERFGLAQLHQLRGRVGRGEKKSYCLLFTESESTLVEKRLSHLKKTTSGFELSEIDLNLRGPGEIFGTRQHGFIDLKIASWSDFDLIRKAKEAADDIFSSSLLF